MSSEDELGWVSVDKYASVDFGQSLQEAMKLVPGHDSIIVQLGAGKMPTRR